jgi:putative hydrolase
MPTMTHDDTRRAAAIRDPVASSPNAEIADRLRETADLLSQQGANPFRVSAYRRAADTVLGLAEGVDEILRRDGVDGLIALPGIGRSLAAAIEEMVRSGRWMQLERLRGVLEPEAVFQGIPGIGPALARHIHDTLEIETLEALEVAANDGRLEGVPGVGARRAAMIRAALATMLGRRRPRALAPVTPEPAVGIILEVDREYREKAAAKQLRKIAPRRFNPSGEAWLPILHAQRDDWHFTALFSNTARAHQFGRIGDWVVMYFHTDHEPERQCTVVTETRGELVGRRVVRGHESECRTHYAAEGTRPPPQETP